MIDSIFGQLANTSSRNEKLAILTKHKDNVLLKKAIFLALDPFTQFYIRKIPSYTPCNANQADSLDSVLDSLAMLSSREVTGNAAIDYLTVLLSNLVESDAKVVERIISKDLKCGVSEATVNAVWPELIYEYPCMLASAYDEKLISKISFPAVAQVKMDGARFNAICKNNKVEYRTRNGKEIVLPQSPLDVVFDELSFEYEDHNSEVVFDGELVVVDHFGKIVDRKTGNGIINKALKGTITPEEAGRIRAVLWDCIPLDAFKKGVFEVPYSERIGKLAAAVIKFQLGQRQLGHLVQACEMFFVKSIYDVQKAFAECLNKGEEGIILKDWSMIWENKRSKKQIKFKGESECDLKIVGWEEGTGKNQGRLGALVLESSDGFVRTNVGTGFTDADRLTITKEVVGKVCAIKYNARISDKKSGIDSLFLPVFVEIREDKTKADSSNEIV